MPRLYGVGTRLDRIASAARAIAAVTKRGLAASIRTDEMLGALMDVFRDAPVIVTSTVLHSIGAHAAAAIGATAGWPVDAAP